MGNPLFATKSIDALEADAEEGAGLNRALTALDLTMLGVGAIIGTGIFVLTGRAAAANAGPAVALSFVVAGIASGFTALCYAEMASMIPVAGSAYSYAYATMGELVAWIIGWDLVLEYLIGSATVSVGWSGYVGAFIRNVFHYDLPRALTTAPVAWDIQAQRFVGTGAIVNLPAVFIAFAVTGILLLGIKESARVNTVIVFLKVFVVILFIVFAAKFVNTDNWKPFLPPNAGTFGHYGISGLLQGATSVFLAYIGFDAISTTAQETKNPQRDLPIGIMSSLAVCTILYVAVSLVLTGVVPYQKLSVPHPIALGVAATGIAWLETVVEVGAIAGLSSVLMVFMLGQPRVFFAMAKDGLFPAIAAKVHPRTRIPFVTTILTGILVALGGGLLPIDVLGELTSIGTLFAFVLVCLGVMILRIKRPDLERKFRVPGGAYLVPISGASVSFLLMCTATTPTILRLILWMAVGLIVYAAYGRRHSKVRALKLMESGASHGEGGRSPPSR